MNVFNKWMLAAAIGLGVTQSAQAHDHGRIQVYATFGQPSYGFPVYGQPVYVPPRYPVYGPVVYQPAPPPMPWGYREAPRYRHDRFDRREHWELHHHHDHRGGYGRHGW